MLHASRLRTALFTLVVLSLLSASPIASAAERLEWRSTDIPVTDVKVANAKMNTITKQGWTPWGLSTRGNKLEAWFIRGPNMFPYDAWTIEFLETTPAQVERQLQALLEQGWLPTGMSYLKGKLAVVALRVPNLSATLHSWLVRRCPVNASLGSCLNEKVTERMNHHYLPMAMDQVGSEVWVFYVRSAKMTRYPFVGWTGKPSVSSMSDMAKNLNGAVAEGLLPMAFLTSGKDFLPLYLIPEGSKAAAGKTNPSAASKPPEFRAAKRVMAAPKAEPAPAGPSTKAAHHRLAFSLPGKWQRRDQAGTAFWMNPDFAAAGVATWAPDKLMGRSLKKVLADVQALTERGRKVVESRPAQPKEGVVNGRPFALQTRIATDAKGRTWYTFYFVIDLDGRQAQTVTAHTTDEKVFERLVPLVAKALDTVSVK